MNENLIKGLYRQIGLNDQSIEARMAQSAIIGKFNTDLHVGDGGGVGVMYDSFSKSYTQPIFVKDLQEATLIRKALENSHAVAVDSDTYQFNIPSSGVPLPLLTIWTTRMLEQLYKKVTLAKITGSWQQGTPGIQEIKIPIAAYNGKTAIYNDFSASGNTSVNINWLTRSIGYFEQTLGWGTMQQAQFGLAKIDYVNKLREALTISVSQFQNDLGFQGYTGIPDTDSPQIFGILNEPNLNAAISLPADGQVPGTVTATTSWAGKNFNQIVRDVQLLIASVLTEAAGHATTESRFLLAIPPSAQAYLSTPNPIASESVREYLGKAFPGIEIVIIPNFEAALVTTGAETNQTVIMALFQHENGEMPYDEIFVTKWLGHRPVAMHSSITEKISMGLGGVLLKYPFLVSYAYGV